MASVEVTVAPGEQAEGVEGAGLTVGVVERPVEGEGRFNGPTPFGEA